MPSRVTAGPLLLRDPSTRPRSFFFFFFSSLFLRLYESGAVIFHGLRRGLIEIASATSARLYLALLRAPASLAPLRCLFFLPLFLPFFFCATLGCENTCLVTSTTMTRHPVNARCKQSTLLDINRTASRALRSSNRDAQ